MLLSQRTGTCLRAKPLCFVRSSRCLSTTAVRPWATPTNRYPSNDSRGSNPPVEDIDLVFDYPTDGQTSHQKTPLEQSGLDLHSAMPHHPKTAAAANMAGRAVPGAQRMAKEMGQTDSNVMYRYVGLGALGLGGLYMMMRRRNPPSMTVEPGIDTRTGPTQSATR